MPERPWVALVTGSASGIGAAIARRMSADGMVVVVHSRTSRDAGLALANELGGTYEQADLADETQCKALIDAVIGAHGRLDVLVNNAGISWPIPHDDLDAVTASVWRRILDVNLIAPWLLTANALAYLRASTKPGGGAVVNITSHAGVRPKGSSIPYAASKARSTTPPGCSPLPSVPTFVSMLSPRPERGQLHRHHVTVRGRQDA